MLALAMDPAAQDADPDIDALLHAAGGIGAYRWGSLVLETSQLAPVDGRRIVEALAGASAGVFQSASASAQRGMIALMHELVHCQQDLSTGLGAWDALTTRHAYDRLVYQARWFVHRYTAPPYSPQIVQQLAGMPPRGFSGQMQADIDLIENRSVARPLLAGRHWWSEAESSGLLKELDIRLDGVDEFSLRSMFEAEAACVVWTALNNARYDEDSVEWLDDHRSLWSIAELDDVYTGPLQLVAMAIANGQVSVKAFIEQLPVLSILIPFMTDLACSYPPPTMIPNFPQPSMFNPVLRFVLMTRALNMMSQGAYQEFVMALWQGEWSTAETLLAKWIPLRYPSSTMTYSEWQKVLAPLADGPDDDAPLFATRLAAIRARRDGVHAKGILAVSEAGCPVQVIVQGTGIRGIQQNQQLLDDRIFGALIYNLRDLELHGLLYKDRPFRCPFGTAGICDSRTARCISGIVGVSEFPQAGCRVRDAMTTDGWHL
jgi:hypothetical protein